MPSSDPRTITSLKSSFLATQIRTLSQPLEFTPELRERSEFSDSILDDVIREVNRLLRRHNKSVYDALAVSNVAEQIDALYWVAGEPDEGDYEAVEDGEGTIRKGEDLADDEVISRLPPDFADSETYASNLARLQSLSTRRAAAKQKLETYKALQKRVEPLKNPQTSVQRIWPRRDGLLEGELAKMRSLGIRVGSRVVGAKSKRAADEEDDDLRDVFEGLDEREKVRRVLQNG